MSSPQTLWLLLGGLALVAVVGVAAWLLLRRRRRLLRPVPPPSPREPRTIAPMVLVHGLLGFDQMRVGASHYDYFRGVPEVLAGAGVEVYCPRLPPLSSVAERSRRLAAFVRTLPHERVNLVGHSMGGLDARYAVSRLGLADRVCSVTTIGTPHLGTPLADVGTEMLLDKLGFARLLRFFGVEVAAFYELTETRMASFSKAAPSPAGVACGSVVGALDNQPSAVSPLLLPCFVFLQRRAGANDGLVPRGSQPWGEVLADVPADHMAQIGWSRRFDAGQLYSGLVKELRARGL